MAKTFDEKVATLKKLNEIEAGLEPAEVEEKPKEVVAEDANAAGAEAESAEGRKPEVDGAAAPEGKTDAEGRKPEGEVDPAAGAKEGAQAPSGWKGEIKFRGETKHLDLTPDELKDYLMQGVNAKTIIAEHDQRVAKEVDTYWKQWGFIVEDPKTGRLVPNHSGAFNWLEAAVGKEKAKQFAAEYAGVATQAPGAGSPDATEELKQIEAELARLDPDVPEDAAQIRVLKTEKRAILAEQNSKRLIEERLKPFEDRTQAADRAAQDYQMQSLATSLKAHRDAEIQKTVKTADPDDLLFVQAKAEQIQRERNVTLDPRNADALKACITDAVKALATRARATVVSKEKEAKALAAAARPAPKSPPPPVSGAGGAVTPPKKEGRIPRGEPGYEEQQVSRFRRLRETAFGK